MRRGLTPVGRGPTIAPVSKIDYRQAGVDYDALDAFKRMCQQQAGRTVAALAAHGVGEAAGTRGESAYLIDAGDHYLAHVEEGLGTKNLVADAMSKLTGRCYYRAIGVDLVATIVNDLITCGASPLVVAMHAAVGASEWFADAERAGALAEGFAEGCLQSGACWGGGETPTLKGVVMPEAIVLGGSAVGRVGPKSNLITGDLADGDRIVMLASSGVQTNGLSLCRLLADRLPGGYLTEIAPGQTYGEALLAPSAIYARFVRLCQERGLKLKYAVHITGHGWRKLMRLEADWVYRIDDAGEVPALFEFIRQQAGMSVQDAYGTFNMGAGFAVYVDAGDVEGALKAAADAGHRAWLAGEIRRGRGGRAVEVPALGVGFGARDLRVR